MAPIFLAFPELYDDRFKVYDYIVNLVFTIDIILNFFSAYYDFDFQIVDQLGVSSAFVNPLLD